MTRPPGLRGGRVRSHMAIERAILREIRLRLREPFRSSRGVVHDRRVLLVTLEAEGGEGWGECVVGADGAADRVVDGAWDALAQRELPALVAQGFVCIEDVLHGRRGRASRMVLAAYEMAAWAAAARAEGIPLSRRLGGERASVAVGVSVGLQPSDEALVEVVRRYLAEGYARVKVKIQPGRDVAMLTALRAHFPDAALAVDANAAYTLADLPRLKALDALGLEMLEQPLPRRDLAGHARLRRELRTPICLDESIASVGDVRRALDQRACGVVNLKPGRVGGFDESLRIHDLLHEEGVPVWCGGMLESGVGRAHNLALASLPGFTLPGDISASRRYWERDIVTPEFEVSGGRMTVPTGPGLGVEIDVERVRALTVREASFVAPLQTRAGLRHQGQ